MPSARVDGSLARRLLRHEAGVHAVPGRELRDLGDALLLHDPADPEPFWNRLEALRWPADPEAFDRRLAEVGILFASLGRQPHIWLLPPYDEPADIHERLVANGFEDAGAGHLMVTDAGTAARAAEWSEPRPGITLERWSDVTGPTAEVIAVAGVEILLAAFDVPESRRAGVIREVMASLADPRFTHYLVRLDGRPAAVARRSTFDGLSYLSSIGTLPGARGRGLGRLVTAAATVDAARDGSEYVHLGVFDDNVVAKRLYESLGYRYVGDPGPDMILTG